ncbi:prolyl-tRNA synthetase, family II [Thiovulum sp. ES]|nr:prolyl-tRNA synthetase, family II [Thiovulum sp. ES]
MRFSRSFIVTSKESPSDATLPSHSLLIRGGYINGVASGLYNFLPLGKIALENIRKVVKEELDKAGCSEVELSFVTPAEMWEESGRLQKFGDELLRFKDRKDNLFVLGPTHEEMMVNLVKNRITSYKQLPQNLYQIKTKFRDEARPRFGLMRGREFLMKDGYSFHATEEDMKREFELMEETYSKILMRLELDFRVVDADSGVIGGSGSKEFMVLADSGEDTLVVCRHCSYGANIETAKRKKPKTPKNEPEMEMKFTKFKTPDMKKIEDLANFFRIEKYFFIKAVVKKAIFEDSEEVVIFFLRGSDELEETKAKNSIGALELEDISEEEISNAELVAGFVGPVELNSKFTIVFDEDLRNAENMICGANEVDYHYIGVNLKDLAPNTTFADLIAVQEGDHCPHCGKSLEYKKGIEVGHIFQLGTQYSEKLDANFLDQNGKSRPFVMGTYGIGVSRLLAGIVEQHHDDLGMVLPPLVSPYLVNILVSNVKNSDEVEFGEYLYQHLQENGVSAILDDRKDRFGFKIKDAELIGFPLTVIIGKSLKDGEVELYYRKEKRKEKVSKDEALKLLLSHGATL